MSLEYVPVNDDGQIAKKCKTLSQRRFPKDETAIDEPPRFERLVYGGSAHRGEVEEGFSEKPRDEFVNQSNLSVVVTIESDQDV